MPEIQLPHIPVLRAGMAYQSLDVATINDVAGGEAVVRVSQANSGLIKRDLMAIARARQALARVPAKRRIEITRKAGGIFLNGTLPVGDGGERQSPDDYLRQLASTSGLPHTLIRRNMSRLAQVFAEIEVIVNGLTRGLHLDVLDRGYGEQYGVPVSFSATTDSLGVILPEQFPGGQRAVDSGDRAGRSGRAQAGARGTVDAVACDPGVSSRRVVRRRRSVFIRRVTKARRRSSAARAA